jgi:DNA modification methylase
VSLPYLLLQASANALPLRDACVQCAVTSPPYWGLRQYAGEQGVEWSDGTVHPLGLEPTPDLYVAHMVEVFREVKRVLRPDGTLWLNLGDSYTSIGRTGRKESPGVGRTRNGPLTRVSECGMPRGAGRRVMACANVATAFDSGMKPKDLVGIPWMVAFALRADGWYLRSDIIWHKPNPMPESVTDRPTKSARVPVPSLASRERYFYDADAIREEAAPWNSSKGFNHDGQSIRNIEGRIGERADVEQSGRNKRTVWTVATRPYSGAHFATYPEDLIEPCILAGSAVGDTVLDPFNGSGTTGRVALRHGRRYVGTDISREYLSEQALRRIDPLAAQKRDVEHSGAGQAVLL